MNDIFDFTIVMAVYNVEPFLREAVESIIAQDFGFEKIQLIMVDDGSTDKSGRICDEYAQKFPNNVVVIHKENGGVSSARNEGLKHAKGRYVNFLDSDDKLEANAMSEVFAFFKEHESETDVVAIPMFFFEGMEGEHPLNYKFSEGSRVVDLLAEPAMFQNSSSSLFIKLKNIRNLNFDKNLSFCEDAKLISQILIKNNNTLGVITGTKYLYRKRNIGEASAVQNSTKHQKFYLPPIKEFHLSLIQFCIEKIRFVPKYIQHLLAYDLQWRVMISIPEGILTKSEIAEYKQGIKNVLQYIEDDVILAQMFCSDEHKTYMLSLKKGRQPDMLARANDFTLHFGDCVVNSSSSCLTMVEFVNIKDGILFIEGRANIIGLEKDEKVEMFFDANNELVPCELVCRPALDRYVFGDLIMRGIGFKVKIPLNHEMPEYKLKLIVKMRNVNVEIKTISFGKFAPLSTGYKNSYCFFDNWRVRALGKEIVVDSYGWLGHIKQEVKFMKELYKKGHRKAVLARLLVHFFKFFKRKKIWIITDRINKADDNGEALFRYVMKNQRRKHKYYFAISKDCPDYKRMKKIGKVVPFMGWRYKLLSLLADFIISSQGDNPFQNSNSSYKDLQQKTKFIFLQHGITQNDLSEWLNRYNKNLKLFVTAAKHEFNSIIENPLYFYDENIIKLVGIPRYDRLYHDEKRFITIMPTWRTGLVSNIDSKTGTRTLRPGFEKSKYFEMYNSILTNKKLFDSAEKLGYKIRFMNHPNMDCASGLYKADERIVLLSQGNSYREVFAQTDLLVTDYSSTAFDFAYLRKPVLYYQADVNEFYESQVYDKGYFDYERDGFGEVEYDAERLAERIIEYMENDCQLKDKYRERIENFFAFNDKNNCERVYNAIMELEK